MEALALLFVIAVFIALLVPEKKPKKPSAGDDLLKGLKAAAGEIFSESMLSNKKGDKPKDNPWSSPLVVVLFIVLLGIVLTSI
ncbi:MAG: hypothetical protein F6K00_27325 [Leptolyngbya sp. SIOISBB]|nr:hypothetical protein [Leptolyngbya sp. SIOISBB]